jgi:hypothetical protein
MNLLRLFLLAPLPLPGALPAAPDPQVIGFSEDMVEAHRLTGSRTVAVSSSKLQGGAGDAEIRVTIDTTGKVIDARDRGTNLRYSDPAAALAAARQWTFRPFQYRGRPVTAVADMRVPYRLVPAWADPSADLPPIDYASLRIELTRGACFGSCPVYKVAITGDGTVRYTTSVYEAGAGAVHQQFNPNGALVAGEHRATIDRAALDSLIEKFRAAHFFGLKAGYEASITDNPSYVLRFSTGGRTMEVTDYVGRMVDMPDAVTALEDEVDRVAGTARWVKGNAETVPALIAEGLDPHSPTAVALARAAAAGGSEQVVLDLIAAGLPLDGMTRSEREARARPLGAALLADALWFGEPRAARALIARGWLPKLSTTERNTLFAESAGGCDPEVAKALVAAGVDPDAHAPAQAEMMGPNGGGTALHTLRETYGACRHGIDRKAQLKALVALGADPNATDSEGQTPIYGIEDPELLAAFLAAGARADVKDKKGRSPAFGSWTDLIVLTLLEAGADPRGKDEGKTLPMTAREHGMPATAAWLAQHGIR